MASPVIENNAAERIMGFIARGVDYNVDELAREHGVSRETILEAEKTAEEWNRFWHGPWEEDRTNGWM